MLKPEYAELRAKLAKRLKECMAEAGEEVPVILPGPMPEKK